MLRIRYKIQRTIHYLDRIVFFFSLSPLPPSIHFFLLRAETLLMTEYMRISANGVYSFRREERRRGEEPRVAEARKERTRASTSSTRGSRVSCIIARVSLRRFSVSRTCVHIFHPIPRIYSVWEGRDCAGDRAIRAVSRFFGSGDRGG